MGDDRFYDVIWELGREWADRVAEEIGFALMPNGHRAMGYSVKGMEVRAIHIDR